MDSSRIIQLIAAFVLVASLAGAGVVVGPVTRWGGGGVTGQPVSLHPTAVSPHVSLAVAAAGPFRALAIDYLWFRARHKQEQGQYYEANQLSRWITSLQPASSSVWAFHAWNMAFNISVETYTPQERWGWVSNGISLLRDEGIRYNPRAVRLYRELGWIYFFKIGKFTDDMHWYYKRRLARDWEELLGAQTVGATTPEAIEAFRRVAEARREVLSPGGDDAVGRLLARLGEMGYAPDENLLRQLGRVLMYQRSTAGRLLGMPHLAERGEVDLRVAELVQEVGTDDGALARLLNALRRKVLEERYRMDTGFMLEMMRRYGPLDWRHPGSHAAYWSDMGLKMAGQDPEDMDLLNTNRQVIHSLQLLTRYGLISFDPAGGQIDLLPDPRFITAYDMAYDLARQRIEEQGYAQGAAETFEHGHENFLLEAMTLQYLYGQVEEANRFYRKVRRLYGSKPENVKSGRYRRPLVQLITEELQVHGDMMGTTSQFIRAMLRAGFERGLGQGRMDVYEKFLGLARHQHRKYQEDRMTKATVDQGRMRLLAFDDVVAETYTAYMQTASVPVMTRVRIWANTPIEVRRRVDERLRPTLETHARQFGLEPERAFPPVDGRSDTDDLDADGDPRQDRPTPGTIQRY